MTLAKTSLAAGLALILTGLTALSLYFGWFTWVATPAGKATITWVLFAALVVVLAGLALRTERRDRADRETRELAELDEWEAQMRDDHDLSMADWRRQLRLEAEMADAEVRRITRADMDRERLTTTVVPSSPAPARGWGQRLTPLEYDYALSYTGPSRVRQYLGDPKPMAEALTYQGSAAWFETRMRAGLPVADPDVVDAPVSPAAPPVYRPRHDADAPRPPAHVIGYNRVAARVLNEATGSFRVVRTEKVLVSA